MELQVRRAKSEGCVWEAEVDRKSKTLKTRVRARKGIGRKLERRELNRRTSSVTPMILTRADSLISFSSGNDCRCRFSRGALKKVFAA